MATVEQISNSATATAQGLIAADAKTTSTYSTSLLITLCIFICPSSSRPSDETGLT